MLLVSYHTLRSPIWYDIRLTCTLMYKWNNIQSWNKKTISPTLQLWKIWRGVQNLRRCCIAPTDWKWLTIHHLTCQADIYPAFSWISISTEWDMNILPFTFLWYQYVCGVIFNGTKLPYTQLPYSIPVIHRPDIRPQIFGIGLLKT